MLKIVFLALPLVFTGCSKASAPNTPKDQLRQILNNFREGRSIEESAASLDQLIRFRADIRSEIVGQWGRFKGEEQCDLILSVPRLADGGETFREFDPLIRKVVVDREFSDFLAVRLLRQYQLPDRRELLLQAMRVDGRTNDGAFLAAAEVFLELYGAAEVVEILETQMKADRSDEYRAQIATIALVYRSTELQTIAVSELKRIFEGPFPELTPEKAGPPIVRLAKAKACYSDLLAPLSRIAGKGREPAKEAARTYVARCSSAGAP